MTATVRNTTTPDSAELRISVTGTADKTAALTAADAFLATSRYTKDATIYEATRTPTGWDFHAEY